MIAMTVAVFMLLSGHAMAERHAKCNHGVLAKTKKCPVLGCGTIGKCAHCRQVERRARANCARCRGTNSAVGEAVGIGHSVTSSLATVPITAPMTAPVTPPLSVPMTTMPTNEVVVASPLMQAPIVEGLMESVVTESPVSLPSCDAPSAVAPELSCGVPVAANTPYESTCSSSACQSTAAKSCSQFYQMHTACDGCGGIGCDGGCATPAPSISATTTCYPLAVGPTHNVARPACSTCGANACDGGCRGYGDVEMTFAESLWANVCCEPYRSNYCSVFGGLGEIEDFYPTEFIPSRGSFDDGWIAGVSKGRFLTKCLRAELEYTFREGSAEELVVGGVPTSWDGELQVHAMMFNAVFQLNYGPLAYISPYYGAGVGVAFFDSDITGLGGNLELEETQFAWQGLFGVNVALSQGVDVFGEYRIMRTSELDLEDGVSGLPLGTTDPEFNTFLVGLRFYR